MHRARSSCTVRNFGFVFDPLSPQYFFGVRQNRLKSFFAHDFNDRLAADFFRRPAKHLGVGATDESEAEIASAASKHERRAIDNFFQFGLLRAQRFLRHFAVAQINNGGLIEQCAVSRRRSDRSAQKQRRNLFALSAFQ